MNHTYKKINNEKVWSISRLLQSLKNQKEQPNIFWLAGQVGEYKGGRALKDALHTIPILENFDSRLGDWVKVQIKSEFLVKKNNELQIRKVEKTELLKSKTPGLDFLNPESELNLLPKWSNYLSCVRSFFNNEGLTEVHTPTLVTCPGPEPTLYPFQTEFSFGGFRKKVFLPTSPELHLKKYLAAGMTDIFEIKPTFRNSEVGDIHEPEFYMLEWYRAFYSLETLMDEVECFIKHMVRGLNPEMSFTSMVRMSVADCFKKYFDFTLEPKTQTCELQKLLKSRGIYYDESEGFNDLFFRAFIEVIEPKLAEIKEPVLVFDYPPSQSALANLNESGWANRFEVYWRGMELANAFDELIDYQTQLQRLILDNLEKLTLGSNVVPIDSDFLRALKAGIPPTSGIALGLERLFCVIHCLPEIGKIKPFSWRWQLIRK